jgi:hypothetical protein
MFYLGCRIPVHFNINVEFFRTHLKNYNDKIICELLEFGAPIGFEGKLDLCITFYCFFIILYVYCIVNID